VWVSEVLSSELFLWSEARAVALVAATASLRKHDDCLL
jgi:hypothetical protein